MPPLAPGSPLPDRMLRRVDGGALRLSEAWRSGPALLAVGHGECGTTRLALPFVGRIHRRRGPGAAVLAILQEDPKGARELLFDLHVEMPACLDEDPYPLSTALGIETVPTVILVSPEGRVRRVLEGFKRDGMEALAAEMGASGPLFAPEDDPPLLQPG